MRRWTPPRFVSGKNVKKMNERKMSDPLTISERNVQMTVTTPAEWWSQQGSRKPGPARIRITVSREFTPAEAEYMKKIGILQAHFNDSSEKLRVSGNRIWAESMRFDSRTLYDDYAAILAETFVNIFPQAVRTFRELNPQPTDADFVRAATDILEALGLLDEELEIAVELGEPRSAPPVEPYAKPDVWPGFEPPLTETVEFVEPLDAKAFDPDRTVLWTEQQSAAPEDSKEETASGDKPVKKWRQGWK